jgi:hypothetical protein
MMMTDSLPPRDPDIEQPLSGLMENLVDPAGNADRAARLAAVITEANELISRLAQAHASVDFARELKACQRAMENILAEVKSHAKNSEKFEREWASRLKKFRDNGI